MNCDTHSWDETGPLSNHASTVTCCHCGVMGVAKPKGCMPAEGTFAVREWICWRLIRLLAERGLEDVHPLWARLSRSSGFAIRFGHFCDVGPWGQPAVVVEHVGTHSRMQPVGTQGLSLPSWLFWFDRWVGRLDGANSDNLLVLPTLEVVPVDWEMTFPWAYSRPPPIARRVDDLDVPCDLRIAAVKSERAREAIRSVTDMDLWHICAHTDIPLRFARMEQLVSFWSGLCTRRDLL